MSKKKICFLYSQKDEIRARLIIDLIDFKDLTQKVEDSEVLIFMLTNNFTESEIFKNNYQRAKQEKKIIFTISIDKTINDYNDFDFAELEIIKLKKFISRALEPKTDYNPIDLRLLRIQPKNYHLKIKELQIKSNEEVLVKYNTYEYQKSSGQNIEIYNFKTGCLLSSIKIWLTRDFLNYWVSFMNQLIVLMIDGTPSISLYDRHGLHNVTINKKGLFSDKKNNFYYLRSISCNNEKEEIYLNFL